MKKLYIYLLIACSLTLSSCNEWLTVQPSEVMSEDEMFETKQGFYDALYGVYSGLRTNYDHNGPLMTTTIEHMGAQWVVAASSNEEKIRNHQYEDAGQQPFSYPFKNQFISIANVNNILKYLESQSFLLESDYNLLKGECLALRAWLHFDLIRIWGPIPGHESASYKYLPYVHDLANERHTYYNYADYMGYLAADLDEAETLLKDFALEDNYRLNYMGVLGLQARVNLWLQDKETALAYAEQIISYVNSEENSYYKFATINNIGTEDYRFRKEQLFGIHVNFESSTFQNTTTLYNSTAFLNELYENSASDIRAMLWTERTVTGLSEPAKDILKYLSGSGSVSIVRLAEIYFIAMECGTVKRANELYKVFCAARGLATVEITTEAQVEDILYKEYRKEFFGEGVMFYYYKRHFTLNIPRNPNKCTADSYVLELPTREVDVNS
ncbi:MAG: RagB/SusD family nutrient uptake outer membrane protein [Mangrovibacterium sp.]